MNIATSGPPSGWPITMKRASPSDRCIVDMLAEI
jgi:hypothetical protein